MSHYQRWAPYVPVAKRRAEAAALAKKSAKAGKPLEPVLISGRAMATTFWGQAWCENLERYSDYANRLPRGRTYARNGSIIDLKIERGLVSALVSGSSLYKIKIHIEQLAASRWKSVRTDCAASIHSLLDLMRGKFTDEVMRRLTDAKKGLFPEPKEIKFSCSCPDVAYLCKHLAAVMYGIGNRLDNSPELFFELRGVDHRELIGDALSGKQLDTVLNVTGPAELASEDLGAMFGIELASGSTGNTVSVPPTKSSMPTKARRSTAATKPAGKRAEETAAAKQSKNPRAGRETKISRAVAGVKAVQAAATVKSAKTGAAKPKAKKTAKPKSR